MTEIVKAAVVGEGIDRIDGPLKVRGAATYTSDFLLPNLAHAALVRSTIAAGSIAGIDTAIAEGSPGVLAVISHLNAGPLRRGGRNLVAPPPPAPLQSTSIDHWGQYVAVVVAETRQQAAAAARLVDVTYDVQEAALGVDDPGAKRRSNPYFINMRRGRARSGLARAAITVEGTFTTHDQTHNPLGLFATTAQWDGDQLTVYDSTQNPFVVRDVLAASFRLPKESVRVLVPFVGGGFGAGLRIWQHTIIAALAARKVGRPVSLVLTRPEMFTGIGHRPATAQHIAIGATPEGMLVAIEHEGTSIASMGGDPPYPITLGTTAAYDCPNLSARDTRVQLNVAPIAAMRAPGEAEGNFALESMLDELSYKVGIDPIELRLRNHADVHPQTGLPWSSKALRACYAAGAERFGWASRNPAVGSMRDGRWLIGYGMAGITYGHYQAGCQARATIRLDGTAIVRSGATDIGTGTYTVMTQLAAEALGLPVAGVTFELGDTDLPRAPQAGGSGLTIALGSAVDDACKKLIAQLLALATTDEASPLRGHTADQVTASGGRLHRRGQPRSGESFAEILARHGLPELAADGRSAPPMVDMGVLAGSLAVSYLGRVGRTMVRKSRATVPAGAFGARFVEIRIDRDLGVLRVARVVSAIDAGRVVNEKLARSQIMGGTVGGIGMALFEETVTDADTGRIANATFGDYLVPVNADVPDMDVVFVGEPDPGNPIGVKGIGEIGIVGIAPAIANAVFHATGRRLRSLPITIDHLI